MEVRTLRVMSWATQGIKLINLKGEGQISSVSKIEIIEDDEEEGVEGGESV